MKIYVKATISDITTESIDVLCDLAISPDTDVQLLEQLAAIGYSNESTMLLWGVANNPNTPKQLSDDILLHLTEMLNHNTSWKNQILAEHSTDSKFLDFLSQCKDYCVKKAVAMNLNTPTETLHRLSKAKSYNVRIAVAENPNTPIETLETLCRDKSDMVRFHIAENPNTPINILNLMANDVTSLKLNPAIYLYLAANPNISLDALQSMHDILSGSNESYIFEVIHKKLIGMQNKH